MSQALYRKWRPRLWNQVIGQDHIIHTLQNAIRSDRVAHAYLFAGPRGTGKTTTARLLAKAVNCTDDDITRRPCDQCNFCQSVNNNNFLDLIEIDAASNTSVDDIRALRDKINFSPSQGRKKIYIIDEVHMLSTSAFNALLKTLEEPPEHAIFILATTEVHKIPATVLSRCQRHEFRRIPVKDIVHQLKTLIEGENIDIETDAMTLIARQSTGSLRDAISLLDQLSSTGEKITLDFAQTVLGTATNMMVISLFESILERRAGDGLTCIHNALDSGTDARQFARQTVDYLRGLLLIQMGSENEIETTAEIRSLMKQHAGKIKQTLLLNTMQLFNTAACDNRSTWQPGLLLELALVESIETGKEHSLPLEVETAPESLTTTHPTPIGKFPSGEIKEQQASKPDISQTQENNLTLETPSLSDAENSSTITTERIKENWQNIKALVKKQNPNTEALLNSIRVFSVKDGGVVLDFPSNTVKTKMEANDNLTVTSRVVSQFFGFTIPISCIVSTDKSRGTTSDMQIGEDSLLKEAKILGGIITKKENKK